MRQGQASRTAQHNALFRALEWSQPASRRVCEDPLARIFLTWPLSLVGRLGTLPALRTLLPWLIDRFWPGVRSAVVARTRLIDDTIAQALRKPAEQLVVLGAGFDSRACRLPALAKLAVFEVDHPDTQAAKLEALRRALGALPPHVRFVASDFGEGDLEARMAAAGFRPRAPSLMLWEGVTNYLDAAAVDATLRWCAGTAPGSRLVFTYIHRDVLTCPERFAGTAHLFASLERAGERYTFGFDPAELPAYLAERGLALETDVGAAEFRERYYGAKARRIRGHEFYRVAVARVGAPTR